MSEREIGEIHAKFRCLGVNHRWDGERIVDLAPIYKDDGAPENALYFESTPSGNAEVKTGPACPFEPNKTYYIDMDRVELKEGEETPPEYYELAYVKDVDYAVVVQFKSGWTQSDEKDKWGNHLPAKGIRKGEIEMQVDNKKAWPHFVGYAKSVWKVTFTEADDG